MRHTESREYVAEFDGVTVLCPACDGTGDVYWCPDDTIPGAGEVADFCPTCGRRMRATVEDALEFCVWSGQRERQAEILVSVRRWFQECGLAVPLGLLRRHSARSGGAYA